MNPQSQRLRSDSAQSNLSSTKSASLVHEFQSAEDLVRADAAATQVPAVIEQRLAQSISQEPSAAPKPWWKRLLGT